MLIPATFSRKPLGFFPTPLTALPILSKKLGGPRILMKRDDLTGLALGGNKTRKLEFLIGDALARNCDTIVTGGADQSNHCRQTAAAAAMCGLECHLVLGGEAPDPVQGNLLLDHLFGANIHWTGALRKGEKIPELVDELIESGRKPCIIPYGGSNEIGALGFVEAVQELNQQTKKQDIAISDIIFASSSGGTQAGFLIGKELTGARFGIVGIEIDKEETGGQPLPVYIQRLVEKTADLLGASLPEVPASITLRSDYTGEGYGVVGDLEREAISLLAQTEGILVDPVYTGRALGGLIDMIRKGEYRSGDTVMFWHTGGIPAIFSGADVLSPPHQPHFRQ